MVFRRFILIVKKNCQRIIKAHYESYFKTKGGIMKLVTLILLFSLCILGCETEYYKLDISISGNGTYKITPQKSEYEEGESVTITAFADSGWKFRRWEGSTLAIKSNPLSLVMDGHKNLRVVFGIPVTPNLTGIWESEQYLINFEIEQLDEFEKDLEGKMNVILNDGSKIVYNVTGFNNSPQVKMTCTKSGYYDISYNGASVNDNRIIGALTEAGDQYTCHLNRVTDSPVNRERIPLAVNKIQIKP